MGKHAALRIVDLHYRSERRPGSTCWWWLGAMASDKVSPRIWTLDYERIEKRAMTGPRAVWSIKHQAGMGTRLAFMACMNSSCVNPEHVGTAADKAEIGAHIAASGKRKGNSTKQRRANVRKAWAATGVAITPPEVVRALRASVGTHKALGIAFGMAHSTVSRIRRFESHRDVSAV